MAHQQSSSIASQPSSPPGRRPVSCDLCGRRDAKRLFIKAGDSYVQCRGCALIYLDPQPSDAELAAIYGEHYYDAWGVADDHGTVERLKRRTFANLLERVASRTGIRQGPLLDLGCATGFLLEEARGRGFEPFGIELNQFSARTARERLGVDRVHCGTLDDSPFRSRFFQVVVMSDLLEHVRSPAALLHRAHQALADSGVLVIVAPNVAGFSRRLLGRHWTDFKREHLYYLAPATLRALLARCSFELIDLRPFPKHLDLAYVHRQLTTFPTPFFSPLVRMLHAIAPTRLRRLAVPIFAGSMLAIARKVR